MNLYAFSTNVSHYVLFIVLMRKYVKQAKTRIINKYVKEIKLLENRKGNENQIAKCKRKAERLLSEVAILKKIKPDSVSKMALSKMKDWKNILNQKNVPLEERCFAILANYEPVQKEVEKFLSDNNYLVSKIPSLLQEWEEKAKLSLGKVNKGNASLKSKFMSKPIQKTKHIVDETPRLCEQTNAKEVLVANSEKLSNPKYNLLQYEETEPSEENVNDSDSALKSEEESEEIGDETLNNINSEESHDKSKEENKVREMNSYHKSSNSLSEYDELEMLFNNKQKLPYCEKTSKQTQDSSPKSQIKLYEPISCAKQEVNLNTAANSTKAIALLNLNELLDLEEIPIKCTKADTNIMPVVEKRKRDTFFLSGDTEEASESDNSKDIGDDNDRDRQHSPPRKKLSKNFPKKDFNSGYSRKKQNNSQNGDKSNYNNYKKEKGFFHSQKFDLRENKKTKNHFHSKEQTDTFGKNQNKYQGRFIKDKRFDDNDRHRGKMETQSFKNRGTFFEKKQNNSNKRDYNQRTKAFHKKAKINEQGPLHPSWEAKRKLKESAKVKFQGKKMVFGD